MADAIETLFDKAMAAHSAGRLAEAQSQYRALLKKAPDHPVVLHFLAISLLQDGKPEQGIEAIRKALAIKPDYVEARVNFGTALQGLGRHEEAVAQYEQALATDPAQPQVHNNLGAALQQLGHHEQARKHLEIAVAMQPSLAAAHSNLGSVLKALGQKDQALDRFRTAVALDPDNPETQCNLGSALHELDRDDEARVVFQAVANRHPDFPHGHIGLGNALSRLNRNAEAMDAFERALSLDPDIAEAWLGLGTVLETLKRNDDAIAAFRSAVAKNPSLAEAWIALGNALALRLHDVDGAFAAFATAIALEPALADAWIGRGNLNVELHRYDEALAEYDHALALQPDSARAWLGRGNALFTQNRDGEALTCFDKAISLDSNLAEAYFGKSLLKLSLGDYREGWELYEWRWKKRLFSSPVRGFDRPLWLGDGDLRGRTILIHSEQGFGDTIHFFRFIPLLAEHGCRIVFEAPGSLATLFRAQGLGIEVIKRGDALPAFDLHCPLMSLPLAFGAATIPDRVPYLRIPQQASARWQQRLGDKARPRAGLVWASDPYPPGRNIPLESLNPLLIDSIEWHAAAKDIAQSDRPLLREIGSIRDHTEALADFAETAALIGEMDVVVSVDTAVAHLAGALGKPVLLLLPFHPDFRWLRQRKDSPWYPTARLFRQPNAGDWRSVVDQVSKALQSLSAGR